MKTSQLATSANLRLAWRRITTGGNHQYKRLFRHLYVAYEVALDNNLEDLRGRLLGSTFRAQQPERIYLPKSSGLHRPLSLLYVEDQIVLQAFANLAAAKLHARRKFAIKHSTSVEDAMGMLPSIADPQRSAGPSRSSLTRERARSQFISSLGGRPYQVQDKTRLRYVLYRAEPDSEILRLVCKLVPHHPEHADAFFSYLGTFNARKPMIRLCLDLIRKNPYPYVRGEAWLVLARHLTASRVLEVKTRKALIKKAILLAKKRRPENFTETLGACHFLAVAETVENRHYSRFLKFQPPLLQALVSDALPAAAFARGEAADAYLRASAFEPGISVCGRIHALGLGPATFNLKPEALPSQVRNTLCELGTIPTRGGPVDPIAEVLQKRYGLVPSKSWHTLLGTEYIHALGLLKQAESAFNASMSYWLANQNSFHNAIFLALQRHLATIGHVAAVPTKGKDGKLIDFGVMLDAGRPFAKNCPRVGDCFRAMNARRNQLPVSHPYEKKTERRSRPLSAGERSQFVHELTGALSAFVGLMP